MNLILAICWLCFAVGMFIYAQQSPDPQSPATLQHRMMAGLGGLLAFYNLVRWWLSRMREKTRRDERALLEQRQHREKPIVEPEFDFSDPPKDPGNSPGNQ